VGLFARVTFVSLGLLLAVAAVFAGTRLTDRGPIDWEYYTPQRFEQAKREGNVVVMDFTAEWCLNCKVIESQVLHTERVSSLLGSEGVVPMKVDLTAGGFCSRRNPDAQQRRVHRGGVDRGGGSGKNQVIPQTKAWRRARLSAVEGESRGWVHDRLRGLAEQAATRPVVVPAIVVAQP
jgi:hypothetical protein